MEISIKGRYAEYSNLKLLLLYMVVYGHLIEARVCETQTLLWIYQGIYSVHMPLFLFLSGLFLKSRESCLKQAKHLLLYYAGCQTVLVLGSWLLTEERLSMAVPVWHLWYLLSLGCMAGVGFCLYALFRVLPWTDCTQVKLGVLLAAVAAGCAAGFFDGIGRSFSLSRTIVFLPYFLAGMFCPEELRAKELCRKRYKEAGFCALLIFMTVFLLVGRQIPYDFYYQADSFRKTLPDGMQLYGIVLRLLCYLMGGCFGFFLLAFIPKKRFCFTRAGADTMWIYLLHGPIAALLGRVKLENTLFWALSPFAAAYIIFVLYKAFQWTGRLYYQISEH